MRVHEACLCGDPQCFRCFPMNRYYHWEECPKCGREYQVHPDEHMVGDEGCAECKEEGDAD